MEPTTILFHVTAETSAGPRGFNRQFEHACDAIAEGLERFGPGARICARPSTPEELPELDRALELHRLRHEQRRTCDVPLRLVLLQNDALRAEGWL